MKAVILAAGYGTRLQRDVAADTSGRFAHLVGVAKPLLPVGNCALVTHWVRALSACNCADSIFVVTNSVYLPAFEQWAAQFSNVQIVSDETRSNNERLGAVACLQLAVMHFKIEDHVVVIGGDTLFKEDFSLGKISTRFSELQAQCEDNCMMLYYQCKDDETPKYGIVEVESDLRATCMKEKPLPFETTSRKADAVIEEKDAPGNFVSWLIPRTPVYIYQISGRFDVGNLQSYIECDLYFKEHLHNTNTYMT